MTKIFIKEYEDELKNQIIPLTVHFAILKEKTEQAMNIQTIDAHFPYCIKRYSYKGYLPGNKFYKPISRTLNV